ncbi:MAG TPA: carboxylesterase family protein [Bryobacteraceae bacterium]|nr:carboxylesterase family protein [Verrucomicrobiae bacterium]HUO29466.1 carboxylesterase family protein [Bryobacteraceae bacterium]
MRSNRRQFMQTLGTSSAGIAMGAAAMGAAPEAAVAKTADGEVLLVGDNIAVTSTEYGKVRGYVLRGVHYFLGMPYGADTSGPNRFMPPRRPAAWTDVYPALWWGDSAPQNMEHRYANKFASFRDHWNYGDVSEDCLRINVLTPAVNDGQKRPVLFWIHGGGFVNGNAVEQDGYNGENFARFGNAVFCSINHRLGPLGYCNLAGVGGEKFAASGNVGMLDIVAALEWVRDNIANFGGDPGNITIMGQSGGGAKVCILTAMPSAKGLFHKAVVLSGASRRSGDKAYSEKLGAAVLQESGISATELDKLQNMPWKDFYAIATKAQQAAAREAGPGAGMMHGFVPVVDGQILPQHPYDPAAAPTAADVPMIISSVENEQSYSWADSSLESITMEQVVEKLKVRAGFGRGFGDSAQEVVESYARAFPGRKPVEIWSLASSNRQGVVALADVKSQQPAPVYVDWFTWQPPLFDHRIRAFHCVDICFWFYNTDVMLTHTGGGPRPRALSTKMAGALLQFMKTGNPNGPGLPRWPKYSAAKGETMVFDDICAAKNDPDREARKALPALT